MNHRKVNKFIKNQDCNKIQRYTAKNTQVANSRSTDILYRLTEQANIRTRNCIDLRQLVDDKSVAVDNRLVSTCLLKLVIHSLAASYFNKL